MVASPNGGGLFSCSALPRVAVVARELVSVARWPEVNKKEAM